MCRAALEGAAVGSAIALREKDHWVGDGGAGGLKPSATCASVVGPAAFFTRRAPVAPPRAAARRGARHHHRRPAGSPGAGWRGGVPSVTSHVDRIRPLDGLCRVADRPLSMRCRWFTGAILVVAAPLALPAPLSGSSLPPMMLWVWERPVDLRDLDVAHVGVAFLAATVHVDAGEVIVVHRHQPLLVPAGTARVAVARIETGRGPLSRPQTGGTCRCRAGRARRPVRRPRRADRL